MHRWRALPRTTFMVMGKIWIIKAHSGLHLKDVCLIFWRRSSRGRCAIGEVIIRWRSIGVRNNDAKQQHHAGKTPHGRSPKTWLRFWRRAILFATLPALPGRLGLWAQFTGLTLGVTYPYSQGPATKHHSVRYSLLTLQESELFALPGPTDPNYAYREPSFCK